MTALEHAGRTVRADRWLDLLARVSRRLTLAAGMAELSRIAVDELAADFRLISVSWWEPVATAGEMRLLAAAGTEAPRVEALPRWALDAGVMARCARTGTTVVANDARADPDYVGVIEATRSELCVPVLHDGRVVGLIDLQSSRAGEFGATAVEVVEAIAAQAAVVRDVDRLRRHQERRLLEQEAVHSAALDVLAARPWERTLGDVVARVMDLCDAGEAALYVLEPDRRRLRLAYATGRSATSVGTRIAFGEGLAGRVAAGGRPLVVDDYSTWLGRSTQFEAMSWRAVAGVPMVHGGEVIGVLDVMSSDPDRVFDADDLRVLTLFAAPAALALHNARRAEEHVADLVAASSVARELSGITDAAAARAAVCATTVSVVGCQAAVFWERDPRGGLVATAGHGVDLPLDLAEPPGAGTAAAQALRSGRTVFARRGDVPRPHGVMETAGCTAVYAQPIVRDSQTAGVLVAGWGQHDGEPTDREVSLLSLLAHDAAVAMERADLVARLDHLARRDSLTGAANRRAWEEALPRLLAAAAAQDRPVSVAMLDLDFFKAFNDVQGHQRGDLLLREVAAAWQAQLRDADLLARYGGEEFAVALPGCGAPDALAIVERLRSSTPAGQTSSAGVAEWDGVETAEVLVARADAALYDAKQAGRDRSVVAGARPDEDGGDGRAASAPWTRWTGIAGRLVTQGRTWGELSPVVRLRDWLEAGATPLAVAGALVGHQARARVEGPLGEQDLAGVVAAAHHRGLGRELDWHCRRAAAAAAAGMPPGALLFLGVGVGSLLEPCDDPALLVDLLAAHGRAPQRTVLEVTEREAVRDMGRFVEVLGAYRALGFRIAVDDVGEGHSTLELLAEALPEYVTLAGRLVADPGTGARSAVGAVVAFAASTGAQVVAAALSTAAQAQAMLDLGVTLGRGPLLSAG